MSVSQFDVLISSQSRWCWIRVGEVSKIDSWKEFKSLHYDEMRRLMWCRGGQRRESIARYFIHLPTTQDIKRDNSMK